MSEEFNPIEFPPTGEDTLRTDLETLNAHRQELFDCFKVYYHFPDENSFTELCNSQIRFAAHFEDSLSSIYYDETLDVLQRFTMVRTLHVGEVEARANALNELVESELFEPAKIPEVEDWLPEDVLKADPASIDFRAFAENDRVALFRYMFDDVLGMIFCAGTRNLN